MTTPPGMTVILLLAVMALAGCQRGDENEPLKLSASSSSSTIVSRSDL